MQPLDPLTLPLQGRHLIEAGAGTGKTYTIALVYLRLLLERGLEVPEILVVTFTNSATEELRGRIRARLRQALSMLRSGEIPDDEPLAAAIIKGLEDRERAGTILVDSLARMDEAAIFTIHGFCRRMLQENAFETTGLFEQEFLEDEVGLRREIIEDFWRSALYGAPRTKAEWAAAEWGDPQGLGAALAGPLSRSEVICLPRVRSRKLKELFTACTRLFGEVCSQWHQLREEIASIFHNDPGLSRDKKKGYGAERVETALQAMEMLTTHQEMAWVLPAELELFADSFLRTRLKKNHRLEHPFFILFDRFYSTHANWSNLLKIRFLQEARTFLLQELELRKRRHSALFFDDLLSRLHDALTTGNGSALAARIRRRYPVALVDEFQDTDPRQYRIFSHIYRQPESGLLMIGDPKQAIYSFRGADIFTYIRARRETPSRFTLDTNYRSTRQMVAAVNALFAAQDSFVFSRDICYKPLQSGSTADATPLLVDGAQQAPLAFWLLPLSIKAGRSRSIAKERATAAAARLTAGEIAHLLNLGRQKQAMIGEKPLTAGDIAVLVRSRHEADCMQEALRRCGVISVSRSRDSVFAGDEARQLEMVLAAVVNPGDEGRVRAALTTDVFGFDAPALDELGEDEAGWERILSEFQGYRDLWRTSGVAAMLRRMLAVRGMVRRLSVAVDGERRLTNFLHLADLLQEESDRCNGMEGLLRCVRTRRRDPGEAPESEQLRLESEENLVRIVTIHKSKGLEYEIVFLPFIWNCRPVAANRPFSFHDPQSLELHLSMDVKNRPPEHYLRAEQERLAEDLRLLYVAVTRARHRCYLCWGQISQAEYSALAWLLHPVAGEGGSRLSELGESEIQEDISRLNAREPLVEFMEWRDEGQEDGERFWSRDADCKELRAKAWQGHIDTRWRITSYSGLAAGRMSRLADTVPGLDTPESIVQPPGLPGPLRDRFSFPRGSQAGTFLHGLFEEIDFTVTRAEELLPRVEIHLERAGIASHWADAVASWLVAVLKTPLDEGGLRLCDLQATDRLSEAGFYFSMAPGTLHGLSTLLTRFGISTPDSDGDVHLQGLMKGYIDLIFRHKGRYYLADYKSNYLGDSYDAYRADALSRATCEHRYDLQYVIYTLALHRYLRQRLWGYDYETHFGGVYYLFLRGMHPQRRTGIHFTKPPGELIRQLDELWRERQRQQETDQPGGPPAEELE